MSKELPTATPEEMLRRFTRELPVALNDHELQAYGKMLAEKCKEQELALEKKKQVTADHNARIKVITNEIKRIADARAKGEELRAVQCGERIRGNVIEIVRLDRGEVVDTRPADLRDLQTTMPLDGAAPEGFDEGPRGAGLGTVADQPLEDEAPLEDEDEEPDEDAGVMTESSVGDQVYTGAPDDHDDETRVDPPDVEETDGDAPEDDGVLRPDFTGVPGRAKGESEDDFMDRKLREREEAEQAAAHPVAQRDRDIATREKEIAADKSKATTKPTRERSKKANDAKGKPGGKGKKK